MHSSPQRLELLKGRGWARNRSRSGQISGQVFVSTSESSGPRLLSFFFLQTEVSLRKDMKREKSWAACSCLHDWSMELGFHGWHQTFSRLLGNLSKKLFWNVLSHFKLTKEQENHSLYLKTVLQSDTSYILHIIHIICRRESVIDWH